MAYTANRGIGNKGEDVACEYLYRKGYSVVSRNFRIKNFGEIDIVAIKDKKTIFVEVKTRTSYYKGSGIESINTRKILALKRICWFYIKNHPEYPQSLRLDAVLVMVLDNNWKNCKITHFENITI
jgi:putative endonuclease